MCICRNIFKQTYFCQYKISIQEIVSNCGTLFSIKLSSPIQETLK